MIYTNKKMNKILKGVSLNTRHIAENDPACPNFVEINGCFLLKDKNEDIDQLNMDYIRKFYGDRTGFEAFYNHIHIQGIELALDCIDAWKTKLNSYFPGNKFHLVLAYDGNECSLRFYKYREREGAWVNLNDMDSYEDEAILVMEI